MINNLIGVGATLLGLAIAKKGGVKFLNSDDDFMVTGFNTQIDTTMFDFIKDFETFAPKAYNLGDGKITIGYGCTEWLDSKGNRIRSVKMGDVISEPDALELMRRFCIAFQKPLDEIMRNRQYEFTNRTYQMLLQVAYGTGAGFFYSNTGSSLLGALHASTDNYVNADLIRDNIIIYYKSINKRVTVGKCKGKLFYECYGLGWSRRAYALSQYIKGIRTTRAQSEKIIIKAY